jgi:hypothetical protein
MSYEQRSLGKRSQPQNYNNSGGHKDGSSYTRKRDAKAEIAGRETSDTLHISGQGHGEEDPAKTGAFENFPDIPERSAQNLITKGYRYLFPI